MNPTRTRLARKFALFALLAAAATALPAADSKDQNSKSKAAPADAYPLTTCVVSDEALGNMGDAITYVHRDAGKPDRVLKFCCDGCVDDFKANPAKFLKKYDEAVAKKKSAPAAKAEEAKAHKH